MHIVGNLDDFSFGLLTSTLEPPLNNIILSEYIKWDDLKKGKSVNVTFYFEVCTLVVCCRYFLGCKKRFV